MSMVVSVVVIVAGRPLSPQLIPRRSVNTMVVVIVVDVIVAVVKVHCTLSNANDDLML
jgi:hypothetical protein